MNAILFVFIILCTVFLASSVSNLMITTNALDYFAQESQLSDYHFFAVDEEITPWLEDHENVIRFEVNQLISIENEGIERVLIDLEDEFSLMVNSGGGLGGGTFFSQLPHEMNIPLNINNDPLQPIGNGEVVMTFSEARHHGMEVGDTLHVEIAGTTYTFEVSQLVKDFMIFPRIFISDEDFIQMAEELSINFYTYAIDVDDLDAFTNSLNRAMFSFGSRADADMFMNVYMVDLMMMIILVIVGICLIGISFVVLRFAIVFTLQEDYKEIGIMKAIGLKSKDVKKVYLIKYLFLAICGASLGFILSAPFSEWLLTEMRERIAFPDIESMILVRLASTVIIILLILVFCLMSTKKLDKYTAMQAIRSGETGERFKRKNLLHLHQMKNLPSVLYLALNDILSNAKSYVILLLVFILGFVLAVMPLNASNTLAPEKFAELINLSPTDFYFDHVPFETDPFDGTVADLRAEFAAMQALYKNYGLEIEFQSKISFGGFAYVDSIYDGVSVNGITQIVNQSELNDELQVLRGVAPMLANEVAVTDMLLDQLELDIGDEISLAIDGISQQFLVVGSYETLYYFGIGVRLAEQVILDDEVFFTVYSIQGNFVDRTDIAGSLARLEEITTDHTLITVAEFIERNMMDVSIVDTIGQLTLTVVIFVNILIIALMSVSFMLRDMKQIALLKGLGFSNKAVKLWQGLRILFVMILSLVLGGLLVPGANLLASIPFGIAGTPSLTISVNVMQVYLLYPLIFIVITALTLMITTLGVKKVGLRDLGVTD